MMKGHEICTRGLIEGKLRCVGSEWGSTPTRLVTGLDQKQMLKSHQPDQLSLNVQSGNAALIGDRISRVQSARWGERKLEH